MLLLVTVNCQPPIADLEREIRCEPMGDVAELGYHTAPGFITARPTTLRRDGKSPYYAFKSFFEKEK